ncbi:unnamed protein product [Adineta ricciae]|uniref:Uncharacterized protein n=2 Tax=Adineta ricciae TaxID=249248 RepID=A0A815LWE4_ADIRI|nr:unnamed protein product [Adineta ricciae]
MNKRSTRLWTISFEEERLEFNDEILFSDQTYPNYKFHVLHHLSGISPYFSSNNDELSPSVPSECSVDKTAYLIRHGSVYVDDYDYLKIIEPFLKRIKSQNFSQSNIFSFLSQWKSPITNSKKQIERLTRYGYFEGYQFGIELSYRYKHLLPKNNSNSFRIWTASSSRTYQSALAISQGLFQGEKTSAKLISISEKKSRGGNTLTPTKSCHKYNASKGSIEANYWLKIYTKSILKKFNKNISNFQFIPEDILAMQELCGYETIIKGQSKFCRLFSSEDWISFEYYFDLKYFYEISYGNYLSTYLGMPWIKATVDLFSKEKQTKQNLFLSITHREMFPLILNALGLFNQTNLPLHQIDHQRLWKTSEILPFLARIAFERLQCGTEIFIRILINSTPKPIPYCSQGPGQSCPLSLFLNYIQQRYLKFKNFSQICQNQNQMNHFTFFN